MLNGEGVKWKLKSEGGFGNLGAEGVLLPSWQYFSQKWFGDHLTYQTDSKNYETCAIVYEIIFPTETSINLQYFQDFNKYQYIWQMRYVSS